MPKVNFKMSSLSDIHMLEQPEIRDGTCNTCQNKFFTITTTSLLFLTGKVRGDIC